MPLPGAGNQATYIAPQVDVDTPATTGFIATRGFKPMPQLATDGEAYKPDGQRYPAFVVPGDLWAEGDIPDGRANFNEATLLLNMIYGSGTITTPAGGTLARQHVYIPPESDVVDPKLYTLIMGDANFRERYVSMFASAINFEWTRTAVTWGGSVMAKAPETQTDNPSAVVIPTATRPTLVPLIGRKTGVFLDPVGGTPGATRLNHCRRVRYGTTEFHDTASFLDETDPSWSELVNGDAPGEAVSLWVAKDSNFHTLYSDMRVGTRYALRVVTTGSLIEGAIPYLFQFDAAVEIVNPEGRDVDRRVVGNVWNFVPVFHAGSLNYATKFTVVNTMTA